jgi:hypothetical protein
VRSRRRSILQLISLLVVTCAGCESLEDRSPEHEAGDPPCDGCYVVNAAITGWGERIFVGGYFGENQTGLVREARDGAWGQVADPSGLHDVRQLWASEHALFFAALDGVRQVDLDNGKVKKIQDRDFESSVVWGSGPDDVVVVDRETVQRFDGNDWTESAFTSGSPDAISGQSSSDLFVLDLDGQVSHSDGGDFALLDAQPPMAPNDIWAADGSVLAVAGDDNGGGSNGPGAIMRYDGERWAVLQDAPSDALLGIAAGSDGDPVFAVGATNENTNVHAVVWRFAKAKWSRHVLQDVSAYLWDVWCSDDDACFAVGTDNTFIDLSELD